MPRTVLISTNGTILETPIKEPPSLDVLQKAVGGHIECVPYFTRYGEERCIAFCNEEGKLEGLPPNPVAQNLWEKAVGDGLLGDFLVGNILLVVGDEKFLEQL